jgi:CRP/FNR family transcriptional regulator
MHLLVEGHLRSFQLAPDGRALLLELIEAGGFDGLLTIAGQRGHFTETVQDSLVAALPWELLERLLEVEPSIAINLVRLIAIRLENREEHLESMALKDPSRRLARQLLALAETLGRREGKWVALKPRLTHQMLADMLGVRRETVTVHLHRLVERGAVQARSGHLYLDRGALERLVASPTRAPAAED